VPQEAQKLPLISIKSKTQNPDHPFLLYITEPIQQPTIQIYNKNQQKHIFQVIQQITHKFSKIRFPYWEVSLCSVVSRWRIAVPCVVLIVRQWAIDQQLPGVLRVVVWWLRPCVDLRRRVPFEIGASPVVLVTN
jgi:hypothetical protein